MAFKRQSTKYPTHSKHTWAIEKRIYVYTQQSANNLIERLVNAKFHRSYQSSNMFS